MMTKTLVRVPRERERRAAARMTGRYILTTQPGDHTLASHGLAAVGLPVVEPKAESVEKAKPLPAGSHMVLKNIGAIVIDPKPDQEDALHAFAARDDAVIALEPERIVKAVLRDTTPEYVRGWRDATDALTDRLIETGLASAATPADLEAEASETWGLRATRAAGSRYSGAGIKIAILDTGLDIYHPDFHGKVAEFQNFVGDFTPFHDGVGHGTHCAGTAAGPLRPAKAQRYGIAWQSLLYAGRVLDDTGSGGDANVLQGIDWAVGKKCEIISLSLGSPWVPGSPAYSTVYESAAQRALANGCLLVVAAGNEAGDPRYIGAVGFPGNSPSVLTVAAVDSALATAPFSSRVQPMAPGVKGPDLAGPGVAVYSAWIGGGYNVISGTSMATPHVAGIAALFAEANPGVRGKALKDLILGKCLALANQPSRVGEIGRGLVQAP